MTASPVKSLENDINRKWLNRTELEKILAAAKARNLRDYALILFSYKHGLRSQECSLLKFSHLNGSQLWIPRIKNGISTEHPLEKNELNVLKKLQKTAKTDFIFNILPARIRHICHAIAKDSGILSFHHHQLRHTCGYDMAIAGIDPLIIKNYLGHKNISNTMIYVEGAGRNFQKLPNWGINQT